MLDLLISYIFSHNIEIELDGLDVIIHKERNGKPGSRKSNRTLSNGMLEARLGNPCSTSNGKGK